MVAFPRFWSLHKTEGTIICALSLALIGLYSAWWMWWGGFAWGTRFFVPLTPFWILLLATLIDTLQCSTDGQSQTTRSQKSPLVQLDEASNTHGKTASSSSNSPVHKIGLWILISISTISFFVQLSAVLVNYANYEIRLREIFPANWDDPLEFEPPAQNWRDWQYSPVLGQWKLIREDFVGNTDLIWFWSDGKIQ